MLEAAEAFPAVVVSPASMKLTWQRETAEWLPHREPKRAQRAGAANLSRLVTIGVNYDIVQAHREALTKIHPAKR